MGGLVLGFDVGGTKIAGALAGADGRLAEIRAETNAAGGPGALRSQLLDLCHALLAEAGAAPADLRAAALGLPAAIRDDGGLALHQNIADSGLATLRADLEVALGCPVRAENDANLAAFAEARARGAHDLAFVVLGTGIGMGLVLDGRIRRGHRGLAGEIAWLPLGADPLDPQSLEVGALERRVGGRAAARRWAERTGGNAPDMRALFDAAASGEPHAVAALDETAALVARAFLCVALVADPAHLVLGGSVGGRAEMRGRVAAALAAIAPVPFAVEPSRLGTDAGLAGALLWAAEA